MKTAPKIITERIAHTAHPSQLTGIYFALLVHLLFITTHLNHGFLVIKFVSPLLGARASSPAYNKLNACRRRA